MRRTRLLVGLIGILALSLVVTGCLNLFAPKVGEVRGKVTYESGTPIEGAEVKLGTAVAKTNAQGEYAFTKIRHGTYDFSVVVNGTTVHTQKVTVGDKPAVVNVTVPDPVQYGKVVGTVKRDDGDPVAGATVRLGDRSTTTDADGAFEFSDVPYGTYTVRVEVDGKEHTEQVEVNAPEVSVHFVIEEAGPALVYDEDFSGPGDDPAAFGWTTHDGWSIVERDGKRWIQSAHEVETRAFIEIPDFAMAKLVIVEYTTILDSGAAAAVRILANDTSHLRGGTNFSFSLTSSELIMRRHTNNNYPGITPGTENAILNAPLGAAAGVGKAVQLRIVYDHENEQLDAYVNGEQVTGYPWPVPTDLLIQTETNTYLMLHSNANTTGLWTDIKVWVE